LPTTCALSVIDDEASLTDWAMDSVVRTDEVTSEIALVIDWVSRAVTSVLRLISPVAAFCCSTAAAIALVVFCSSPITLAISWMPSTETPVVLPSTSIC